MLSPSIPRSALIPAATVVTASANYPVKRGQFTSFVAFLNVTAESGTTPTLAVKFQDSPDGVTWNDIPSAAFTGVTTSNSSQRLAVSAPFADKIQAVVTVGGTTPSYTMQLDVVGCNH